METIEYDGVKINIEYAKCCDTCLNSRIGVGYSGRKSNGICYKHNVVISRACKCKSHKLDDKKIKRMIGGSKGQAKWFIGYLK